MDVSAHSPMPAACVKKLSTNPGLFRLSEACTFYCTSDIWLILTCCFQLRKLGSGYSRSRRAQKITTMVK